jgi:hypothetical protein
MHLALTGVYRARWSAQVHDEWKRNLLRDRPDLTQGQVDRISSLMDKAVPGSLVTEYEPLIEGLELPDMDDRHVLAAAIKCHASVIVTFNLKDFPTHVLDSFDIEPMHPDDFIADLWDLDQAAVLEAAQRQRATLKKPPLSAREFLDKLLQQKLPETVNLLSVFEYII